MAGCGCGCGQCRENGGPYRIPPNDAIARARRALDAARAEVARLLRLRAAALPYVHAASPADRAAARASVAEANALLPAAREAARLAGIAYQRALGLYGTDTEAVAYETPPRRRAPRTPRDFDAGTYLPRIIAMLKTRPPEQRAALLKRWTDRLNRVSHGHWEATSSRLPDGSTVFIGTTGKARIVDPRGDFWSADATDLTQLPPFAPPNFAHPKVRRL